MSGINTGYKKETMSVNANGVDTDVRLVVCHSNIRVKPDGEIKTVRVKEGYTFVFLTEVGFSYLCTQKKFDVFKSEEGVKELLSSGKHNDIFRNGTNAKNNPIKYNQFKAIYTADMVMPDHEIEMSGLIGDASGIFSLPLPQKFSERPIQKKWEKLINKLENQNIERNLTNNEQTAIKNYVKEKEEIERKFGKMKHRYYGGTSVDTTSDFKVRQHKEMKRPKPGEYKRAFRTLGKMMAPAPTSSVTDAEKKRREFHSPPGIYIITGCRNIGFEDEPEVKQNGTRTKVNTNIPFNKNVTIGNILTRARKLNSNAKNLLRLNRNINNERN